MHITLVGMSNIGKTHWSNRLAAEAGFERIDCDFLVEQKLGAELTQLGYAGIEDVAKWMGQPYASQYPDTSRKFVNCERVVMQEILDKLQSNKATKKDVVIDTTGSVIYTGDEIAEKLRGLTHIIYLQASRDHVAQLYEKFIAEPKPIIWGDSYQPNPGEASENALKRCYPKLAEFRASRYARIAHSIIPFEEHKRVGAGLHCFGL